MGPKFVRTLFHQLISGIEYLHTHKYAHLDIKLSNLAIGEDFKLKILDFDAYSDPMILGKGTCCFRAPELMNDQCQYPQPSDIYSVGIT
eukprot:CAMPEP_0114590536 /NCGR_PEP_ID=MMETSP0125-20121206/12772_1 /TAXON_ID=485358 ORGANISM="Aristerostoma sp., Strain ATCC 50986" /NCGR_SAMPLE_ID=MMETSP0125 /ASSEMBLY_ACC=CAM_ASM_000245 /LENGTH=88 /DNA_ID=CAMNT_0001788097 /DNA_START=254 /DNA_END=516 /DNA_ORIENTATION=+